MRILLTADFHLKHIHKYTSTVEGTIWDVMFEEKMKLLHKIPFIMKKYECSHLIIAGDVFDTINPPESIKAEFCNLLNIISKEVKDITIIPGNHETTSYGNHALMDLKEAFGNDNLSTNIHIREAPFCFIKKGALIDHLMLEGVDPHYKKVFALDDEKFRKYPTILLGDYHSYYCKKFADKTFIYPGSPYPTRFGETSNSMVILDLDNNGKVISHKRLKLKSYSMIEDNLDVCNVNLDKKNPFSVFKEHIDNLIDRKSIFKLNITCNSDQINFVNSEMKYLKSELLKNNDRLLDFVYIIKTAKNNKVGSEIENRTIEDVSLEYIESNCEYPKDCIILFKKLLSGAK